MRAHYHDFKEVKIILFSKTIPTINLAMPINLPPKREITVEKLAPATPTMPLFLEIINCP